MLVGMVVKVVHLHFTLLHFSEQTPPVYLGWHDWILILNEEKLEIKR